MENGNDPRADVERDSKKGSKPDLGKGSDLYDQLAKKRNDLADGIARLRRAAFRSASTRERLPQPLFWSLFNAKLADLRREKERQRALRKALFGIES